MTLNNDNHCQLRGFAGATISNDIVFNGIIYINKSCNVLILCWFNSQSEEIPSSIKTMNMKKTLIHGNFLLNGPTKEDIDKDKRCSKENADCSMRFCTTLTRCWPFV